MKKAVQHKLDIYTELCPASSIAIIGSGLITASMGEFAVGTAVAITGFAVGVAGPVAKTFMENRISGRH